MFSPKRVLQSAYVFALVIPFVACAHRIGVSPPTTTEYSRSLAVEANAIAPVTCEEDYIDARLVYQGLHEGTPEKLRLRENLLTYLLGQQSTFDADVIRKKPGFLGGNETIQVLEDSFTDALDLIPAVDKASTKGPFLSKRERALLTAAAKVHVAIFSPRGDERPVVKALVVLDSLEGTNPEWKNRLDQVLTWIESTAQMAASQFSGKRAPNLSELLADTASAWPSPLVLKKLADHIVTRQDKVAGMFRRPIGTGDSARSILGEILFDSETVSHAATAAIAQFLRCEDVAAALDLSRRLVDKPSDDVELRQLLLVAASPGASPADLVALSRRFLPKIQPLAGTSPDYIDPRAAMGVLALAIKRAPAEVEPLLLSARAARLLPAPLLALRQLEEVTELLVRAGGPKELLAELAAERMELAFLRLRMRMDPERLPSVEQAANRLRADFAETRKRHVDAKLRLDETDIDYLLATGMMDAGQADRADPLLERARKTSDFEAGKQLANLFLKRGETAKAIALLDELISRQEANSMARDTVGYVEGQARLNALLGNAHDAAGDTANAKRAWGQAARYWERLMLEFLRRKNLSASAEATFEVGRHYYLLGRAEEGIRKLFEAVEQDEDRDQSYLDGIAFLVQRGETEASLDLYRRALARPGSGLSEYLKVYASLWILDLTRRSQGTPDAGALNYLQTIASRQVALRPPRSMPWYTQLARWATRQISFEALLAQADTKGKRAEAYFYEGMHQLELNSGANAHELWNKVIETQMVSFFEYEMASRYLRCGAPTRPQKTSENTQTI